MVTRTSKTDSDYRRRASLIWARAARELGVDSSELLPFEFLRWLESLLPKLKPATRRQYLMALRENIGWKSISTGNKDFERIREILYNAKSSDFNPGVKEKRWRGLTSSQKKKKFSIDEFICLKTKVGNMRGKWIPQTLLWMAANTLVGLRPVEWRDARFEVLCGVPMLVVKNAKHTNNRAFGDFRHLDLSRCNETEIRLIQHQLESVHPHTTSAESWDKFYTSIRYTMYRICRDAFPGQRKYPTLYSSRHQFAADAKASGLSKEEVAALMGHAVTDTACSHYGKRRHGRKGCRVRPSDDDVTQVRSPATHSNKPKPMGK